MLLSPGEWALTPGLLAAFVEKFRDPWVDHQVLGVQRRHNEVHKYGALPVPVAQVIDHDFVEVAQPTAHDGAKYRRIRLGGADLLENLLHGAPLDVLDDVLNVRVGAEPAAQDGEESGGIVLGVGDVSVEREAQAFDRGPSSDRVRMRGLPADDSPPARWALIAAARSTVSYKPCLQVSYSSVGGAGR